VLVVVCAAFMLAAVQAHAANDKPNILVIISDDVGITNVSAYSMGMAGYHTPNLDRIAKDGVLFTDYYSE
jgi:arylsulfatase